MRKGFTLIEITLAMLIMGGGILAVVGLYAFGYRENQQSREDVASAAYADAVISPLVMAISATNLKWKTFCTIKSFPDDTGWLSYCDSNGNVQGDPSSKAQSAFTGMMGALRGAADGSLDVNTSFPTAAGSGTGLKAGLVIQHKENDAVVRIAFRAARKPKMLLSAPLYYTEVRFQGLSDK